MSLTTRTPLQGAFSLIWSGDTALQPRPVDLKDEDIPSADGDDAEAIRTAARERRESEQKVWDKTYENCVDTRQWGALLKPGGEPTVFQFELPKGEDKRVLFDEFFGHMIAGRSALAASRLVRSCLKSVTNWPGPKIEFVKDDGRDLVCNDVISFLDENVTPRVIGEFAGHISERLKGPSGK